MVVGVGEVGDEDAPGDSVDDEVVGEEEESSGGGGSEGEVDGLEHDAVFGVEAGLGGGLVFGDGGGDVGVAGEVGLVEEAGGVDAARRWYPQFAFAFRIVEGEAEDVVVVDQGLQCGGEALLVEVGGNGQQDRLVVGREGSASFEQLSHDRSRRQGAGAGFVVGWCGGGDVGCCGGQGGWGLVLEDLAWGEE
ncbi:predicted protein [Streptomyces iranensis]|uniref:Uncharacterized protein n=1 Tax=Streptomyces iranensis TaxID=576784 RepID=A0A060ZPU3_9ACTN|nr:predicted protein [Streptomyces iranensis]